MKNFIKSLSALAIMLMCYLPSNATHLMGGDIWVETTLTGGHILKHTNYRDTLGIPAYAVTNFSAFKWNTVTSVWDPISAPPGMSLNMPMDSLNSGALILGVPYGVEFYNYESVPGLLDSIFAHNGNGRYRFNTHDCCRNNAIQNLTQKTDLIIHCEYTYNNTLVNQSPRFLSIPVFFGPVNNAWTYNPLPFDPDGDSLVWVVDTPVCSANAAGAYSYCAGYTTPPSVSTGPFTLNSATGQLTWTPSTVGNFVASFIVKEYRNNVQIGSSIRDMQYIVVPDTNSSGPIAMPEFVPVTGYGQGNNGVANSSYNYQYYYPGSPMSFTIGAMDQNNSDVLNMTAFSSLINNSNATFNYSATGTGNMVHGTFNWTPPANETQDHMVVIRANDGAFSKDFTIILKKYEAPTAVNDIDANAMNITVYPNPAKANSAISFKIVSEENMSDLDLRIVDLSGKVVATQEVKSLASGVSTVKLNSELQAGFYLAQFIDAKENKKQLIKFVVQ